MRRLIFYLVVIFLFLAFVILIIFKNINYDEQWKNEMTFDGIVQNVVHIKNEKGSFFEINNVWYDLSYNKLFEEQNFIGCKVEKRKNEKGFWMEKVKGSDSLVFYWSSGNIVRDNQKLKVLNQYRQNSD